MAKKPCSILADEPLATLDYANSVIRLLEETVPAGLGEGELSEEARTGLFVTLQIVGDAIEEATDRLRKASKKEASHG